MCNLNQLGMDLAHNAIPYGGVIHKTKTPFPRAWGICILESQQKLTPNQPALFNLGTTTSQAKFEGVMLSISGAIRTYYNRVRVVFDPRTKAEELAVLKEAKEQFRYDPWRFGGWHPVAFFAWKLLDITEIVEPKNPAYLQSLEAAITTFHRNLELEKARQAGHFEIVPNNLVDDIDILENFPPTCTQQWRLQTLHAPMWTTCQTSLAEQANFAAVKALHQKRMKDVCYSIKAHYLWETFEWFFPSFCSQQCWSCGELISPEFHMGRHMGLCDLKERLADEAFDGPLVHESFYSNSYPYISRSSYSSPHLD